MMLKYLLPVKKAHTIGQVDIVNQENLFTKLKDTDGEQCETLNNNNPICDGNNNQSVSNMSSSAALTKTIPTRRKKPFRKAKKIVHVRKQCKTKKKQTVYKIKLNHLKHAKQLLTKLDSIKIVQPTESVNLHKFTKAFLLYPLFTNLACNYIINNLFPVSSDAFYYLAKKYFPL